MKKLLAILMTAGLLAGLTACGGEKSEEKKEAASPKPTAEMKEHIEARQKIFDEEIKEDMKTLGEMVKTNSIEPKKVAKLADSMKESFGKLEPHFPEGSHTGKTDAKKVIWEEPKEFGKKSKEMGESLAKLKKVAESGAANKEIAMQIKAVGDSCKACHEEFKVPKEDSYKKK